MKFVLGSWHAVCDRCGFTFYNTQLKDEWTGLKVCESCWESRHPQDFARIPRTEQPLPWTRPEPADVEIDVDYVDSSVGVQE